VEFHGVGVDLDAVLEKFERFVEAAFVVELVGVFVVVVGAEKPFRHQAAPPAVVKAKVDRSFRCHKSVGRAAVAGKRRFAGAARSG
jgi:hypothetical protein